MGYTGRFEHVSTLQLHWSDMLEQTHTVPQKPGYNADMHIVDEPSVQKLLCGGSTASHTDCFFASSRLGLG